MRARHSCMPLEASQQDGSSKGTPGHSGKVCCAELEEAPSTSMIQYDVGSDAHLINVRLLHLRGTLQTCLRAYVAPRSYANLHHLAWDSSCLQRSLRKQQGIACNVVL